MSFKDLSNLDKEKFLAIAYKINFALKNYIHPVTTYELDEFYSTEA